MIFGSLLFINLSLAMYNDTCPVFILANVLGGNNSSHFSSFTVCHRLFEIHILTLQIFTAPQNWQSCHSSTVTNKEIEEQRFR